MAVLSLHSMTPHQYHTVRTSIITTFFVFEFMRNAYLVANSCRNPCWAPSSVCKLRMSKFFIIVNYMYQAYEQMNKVLQGHWERMTICQYTFHSIIPVNSRCFSLRQTFETVHMCTIESTGHPEEACSLQPKLIMTGMGNSFLTIVSKLITLDTPGACISCVLFPNLWSWPSPPRNTTTPPSDTTTTIPPSDRYIPGRCVSTPEQLWGRIAAR